MTEILDLTPDIQPNLYRIEITRSNGSAYVAELPREYADGRTRLQKFGKGIVVVHPLLPKVYINGTTGQFMQRVPPAGNLAMPRLTGDPSFVWTDPDSTTDASTTNIGTGVVRLQAKSLRGFVTYTPPIGGREGIAAARRASGRATSGVTVLLHWTSMRRSEPARPGTTKSTSSPCWSRK